RRAGGWLVARRSFLGGFGRGGGAFRPAARRRQRAGAAHDRRDRQRQERAEVHREREEWGRRQTDGVWPSRLQELRSARQDREKTRRRGLQGGRCRQGSGDRSRAGADRAFGRIFHVEQALSQRRFLYGADLPIDGVPDGFLHGAFRNQIGRAHV